MVRTGFHIRTEQKRWESERKRRKNTRVNFGKLKLRNANKQVSSNCYFIQSNCDTST